uniref:dual-specificity kinase n=1 Tax=Latimeria chalumnae TaxID=7897 RepID=H2ZZJ0_LATCH
MRQSKRMRSPDWGDEVSWDLKFHNHKRKKRSHSSEREDKPRKHHIKIVDCHYLDARSLKEHAAYHDSWYDRDDAREEYKSVQNHKDSSYRNHYSKSSGRSSRHRRKHRKHHSYSSHSSHSRNHRRKRSRSVEDDEEGHLIYQSGDVLRARYEIVCTLGEGAFGKVVECTDHKREDARVAIKIIKNVDRYREAAFSEVKVLEQINSLDTSHMCCVKMFEWFEVHGHVCIVFEMLGLSTYDFLKENNFMPFQLQHIRHMAYQICSAVNILHQHKLTHTDLKPENILFVNPDYIVEYNPKMDLKQSSLSHIDILIIKKLGGRRMDQKRHGWELGQQEWGCAWISHCLGWCPPPPQKKSISSTGLLKLKRFHSIFFFFQTHDSKEHLAMMERILGPLPTHMIQKTRRRKYFHHDRLDWDEHSSAGRYVRKHCKPLKQYMVCQDAEHEKLFDLIGQMLEFDPAKRITLDEALQHPFFDLLPKNLK